MGFSGRSCCVDRGWEHSRLERAFQCEAHVADVADALLRVLPQAQAQSLT